MNKPEGNTDRRQRVIRFMTHLICILMLFFLPEVISQLHHRHRPESSVVMLIYVKSVIYVAVFYVNYYWLIGKATRHNRWIGRLCLYNVAVTAVATVLFLMIFKIGLHPERPWGTPNPIPFLVRDLVIVILTIALSVALKMSDNWTKMRQKEQELLAISREEELAGLKSQLNPHFLFNSLNTIYALIEISPEKAREAVHELSRLLRYVLYENPSTVRLADEIGFIDNYVSLMRLRLGDKAAVEVNIDCEGAEDTPVPPLLFIPVVENMFKHGIANDPTRPMILSIHCDGESIECLAVNHISPADNKGKDRGGIGIANLGRRLALTYGEMASLSITRNDEIFSIAINIRLKPVKTTT